VPRGISYTDAALADLAAITEWLMQPGAGPAVWRRMLAIWGAIERLREHPCLHAVGLHPGVRELPR
jgi:plasmid stabilization system protein ParE